MVIWRWSDGRWRYDDGLIGWTDDRDAFVSPRVRPASTTAALVAIARGALPDTTTDAQRDAAPVWGLVPAGGLVVAGFLVGLAVTSGRRGPTRRLAGVRPGHAR